MLPDGSRLVLKPGFRGRLAPPREGERIRLEIDAGELSADVAKEKGAFRIVAPGGEVQVLGTRLRVKVFRLSLPEAPAAECVCLELFEGRAALRTARGRIVLNGSGRGIAVPDAPPLQQELGGSPEKIMERFSRTLERDGSGLLRMRPGQETEALSAAATFWGAGWDGADPMAALKTHAVSGGFSGVAELLGKMGTPREESR